MKFTAKASQEFYRIWHIIGDRNRRLLPILPISRATWYRGVRNGIFPKPIRLSSGVSAWSATDIKHLCQQLKGQTAGGAKNER